MATKKPASRTPRKRKTRRKSQLTLAERIAALTADISDEEMAKLPRDGAANHDHYIYGTAKQY